MSGAASEENTDEENRRLGVIGQVSLWLSGLLLVAIMVLIMFGLVARNIFQTSFDLVDEFSGYLLVGSFFMSMAACQLVGALYHVDVIRSRLSTFMNWRLDILFNILAFVAVALLVWYLARFGINTYKFGERSQTVVGTPLWIPRVVMPIGAALLLYAIARSIVMLLRSRPTGDA